MHFGSWDCGLYEEGNYNYTIRDVDRSIDGMHEDYENIFSLTICVSR